MIKNYYVQLNMTYLSKKVNQGEKWQLEISYQTNFAFIFNYFRLLKMYFENKLIK